MIRKLPNFLFGVGLLIAFCAVGARAQYEDGSLTGTIHDATGAVVSNANGSVPVSTITGNPTSGGQITSTFEPRIFQFALKVIY